MRRLTPDDPPDPFGDGSTDSRVREIAIKSLTKGDADMSDLEHLTRATDEYWLMRLCLSEFGALPEHLALRCRDVTRLQAMSVIAGAYDTATKIHYASRRQSRGA